MLCAEIELLRRNVTLFRGKTHMFRGKTNVFLGIVALRRLNTCLLCLAQVPRLKTKPFYMKLVNCFIEVFLRRNTAVQRRNMRLPLRNTAVLRENRRLLRGNLKHPPDCTPYKFLMLLVSGEEEIRLEYHKLLLLSNPAMKKWYAFVLPYKRFSCKR